MAQLINAFNPMNFDPTQSSGGFPIGRHKVVATASEVKATKANDGGFLEYTLEIIEGPNAGTSGPYRLNLYNANEKAVEIANRQLCALCYVTNTFQLGPNGDDSAALHNKPFCIEVGPQKLTKEQQDAVNRGESVTPYTEIKKVFDVNGNEPTKSGQGQQPAQMQQQQNGGNWGGNQQQGNQQQNNQQGGQWGGAGAGQQQNQGQQQQQQQQGGNGGTGAQWAQGGNQQQNQGQQQQQGNQQQNGQWQPNQTGNAGGGAPWGQH